MKRKILGAIILGIVVTSVGRGNEIEDGIVKELIPIGEFYINKKAYGLAIQWFKKILERYPNTSFSPEIKLKIANCLEQRGSYKEAIEVYREIEKAYPGTEECRQALIGEIHNLKALRRNEELLGKIDTFLTAFPNSNEVPDLLYLKADLLREKWEEHLDRRARDSAIQVYKMLILKFPQHPLVDKAFERLERLWRDVERYEIKKELWEDILIRLLLLLSYYW